MELRAHKIAYSGDNAPRRGRSRRHYRVEISDEVRGLVSRTRGGWNIQLEVRIPGHPQADADGWVAAPVMLEGSKIKNLRSAVRMIECWALRADASAARVIEQVRDEIGLLARPSAGSTADSWAADAVEVRRRWLGEVPAEALIEAASWKAAASRGAAHRMILAATFA